MSTTENAAQMTMAAASALLVSLLGVEPQALAWSLVGCVLGVTLAKSSGRFYAVCLFIAATLVCAMWGTMASDYLFSGNTGARNSLSVVFGICFHPILANIINLVPPMLQWAFGLLQKRFGGS